jgi:hypothetical protein
MEARRSRRLVEEHLLVSALALALVVSGLSVVITLAVTGDLPSIRTVSTDLAAESNEVVVNLPGDRMAIGVGAQSPAPHTIDRADTISGLGTTVLEETTAASIMDRADTIGGYQGGTTQAQASSFPGSDVLDGELGPYWLNINQAGTNPAAPNSIGPVP